MFIVACIVQPLRSLGCKACTILVMVSIYLPLPVQSFSYVYYSNPYSFISVREWDEKTRIKTLVLGSMPSTASSFCMFPSFTDLQTGLMAMSKASRLLYIHHAVHNTTLSMCKSEHIICILYVCWISEILVVGYQC